MFQDTLRDLEGYKAGNQECSSSKVEPGTAEEAIDR